MRIVEPIVSLKDKKITHHIFFYSPLGRLKLVISVIKMIWVIWDIWVTLVIWVIWVNMGDLRDMGDMGEMVKIGDIDDMGDMDVMGDMGVCVCLCVSEVISFKSNHNGSFLGLYLCGV